MAHQLSNIVVDPTWARYSNRLDPATDEFKDRALSRFCLVHEAIRRTAPGTALDTVLLARADPRSLRFADEPSSVFRLAVRHLFGDASELFAAPLGRANATFERNRLARDCHLVQTLHGVEPQTATDGVLEAALVLWESGLDPAAALDSAFALESGTTTLESHLGGMATLDDVRDLLACAGLRLGRTQSVAVDINNTLHVSSCRPVRTQPLVTTGTALDAAALAPSGLHRDPLCLDSLFGDEVLTMIELLAALSALSAPIPDDLTELTMLVYRTAMIAADPTWAAGYADRFEPATEGFADRADLRMRELLRVLRSRRLEVAGPVVESVVAVSLTASSLRDCADPQMLFLLAAGAYLRTGDNVKMLLPTSHAKAREMVQNLHAYAPSQVGVFNVDADVTDEALETTLALWTPELNAPEAFKVALRL